MQFKENQNIKFPFKLILASASSRRQELLKNLGFSFSVNPTNIDESYPLNLVEHEIPIYLAEKKADARETELKDLDLLIAADTIVWCEKKIFNKPLNFLEAKVMLEFLSDKMHKVYTAVCLKTNKKKVIFYDVTNVYFKKLLSSEIEYYLSEYKPYDKAGSYGAQDWIGFIGIDKIEGSFYNVMGLPVKKLYEELMKF